MNWLVLSVAFATFAFTLFGGLIIVKFRKYLHHFFAFAAGSIITVAFLELLPESLEVASQVELPIRTIMLTIVFSFFFFSLLERLFLTHHVHGHDGHGHIMGPIGAGGLIAHSFLDGIVIGAAFQVNASVGMTVALAVIFHKFTDGINTVTLMLKNKHHVRNAIIFLIFAALAPTLGIIAATSLAIPQRALALILAVFVGQFLYIGASSLLPELKEHMSRGIIAAMALGIAIITVLTSFLVF